MTLFCQSQGEGGEKWSKSCPRGYWMTPYFGKLSAVCHLLTEATKRHFPTCSAPALEPQPLCAASPQLTGGSLRWEKAIIHRLPKSKVLLTPFIYYQQPLTLGCAFSTSGFREKGPGRESHVLEVMSSWIMHSKAKHISQLFALCTVFRHCTMVLKRDQTRIVTY